ncbi:UPF0182 family membrane protein [Nocardioides sambongensis]|uniref:UPF0182 family membrane protein n=1 Tax=Nocardioides sambongensis TaxID=2589074 RepID=UPI00112C3096|nr:UPF0182 family protein [Nocardioides sambongensis]
MSELFDEEPDQPTPARSGGGRGRALVITVAVLIVGFFLLTAFASVYTDRMWYRDVGYGQVFSTLLWTRVGLFLVFGALMGAAVAVAMYVAYRFRPMFRIAGGDASVERYRDAVTPVRGWLLAGVSIVVGLFAGTSALGQWRTYLMWRNAEPFGTDDPYFGRDIGFYIFQLPWWHFVVDFVMAVAIVALIATVLVHYLYGGIRLQVRNDRLSGAAQVQISVILGTFVLAKAADYYLDRYDLVTDDHSLFTGMNYTAENAVLPARNILLGVALICAILFFLNIWRRSWQLPSVGLALLALSSILLGMIWPAIVQSFQVKPSEADKEASYIQANIDATRDAYDVSDVEIESYSGAPPDGASAEEVLPQLDKTPVVDSKQVRDTFEQLQQPRVYYSVGSVLDVDRYTIDGEDQPLVLGAREMDQSGLNPSDQNWSNLHTVYTHGEGVIAAYANQVSAEEGDGRMVWAEGISSDTTDDAIVSENALGEFEERIYFGESSPSYSIVGKSSEGADDVELGLADTDTDEGDTRTTYDGESGVDVGSTFSQLMYAIKFGEPNFLLSGRVNGNSRLLYDRDPVTRVEKVAPWLTVDSDPYPAVVDGKIQWIVDGYTTTDRYPNSQRESFESMIEDSLQEDTGLQTIPTDEINYMRSAVKATVDAYDGTVTLYEWDEEDPILQTWMKVFPDTVQPKSEISEELRDHLRYPEDLFKVQRYQLASYHVTGAGEFYQGSDRWEVPQDPNATTSFQPPYRMFTDVGDGEEWSLTSVFVPRGKGNLASFVSANSDANSSDFGQLKLLEMTTTGVNGPGLIANEMSNNDDVRAALRPYEQSSNPPVYGNVLTVPVDDGLMYLQPVYAVRSGGTTSSFRILQFVIVSYGEQVGIGRNLSLAMDAALGDGDGSSPDPDPGSGDGDQGGGQGDGDQGDGDQGGGQGDGGQGGNQTVEEQIDQLLAEANDAFDAAEQAQADGDTVEWARQVEIAQDKVQQAAELAGKQEESTEPAEGEE